MKASPCKLVVLLYCLFQSTPVFGESYSIVLSANEEVVAEIQIKIDESVATATVGDETERFDLANMRWLDESSGEWVTLAQCKQWAERSKTISTKSADSAPATMRSFILWSLSPQFQVEKRGDTLRLTSGQVDYTISGEVSRNDVEGYFLYATLNSYKKAMKQRKLPPFAELKAIDEMRKLGYIPGKVVLAIPGVPGAPEIEMRITKPGT